MCFGSFIVVSPFLIRIITGNMYNSSTILGKLFPIKFGIVNIKMKVLPSSERGALCKKEGIYRLYVPSLMFINTSIINRMVHFELFLLV